MYLYGNDRFCKSQTFPNAVARGSFVPTQVVQCGLFCLRKGPNKHMNERPELRGEKPVLNVAFWV